MKAKIQTILLCVGIMISTAINIFLLSKVKETNSPELTADIEEVMNVQDTLSDWDVFTLALMKVESEYNNNAVSSVGAKGYFQMTPIYVKEVNRIHKTNFTFDQVTDFDKAYEIFDLMQKAHNPDYNMDRALELHNGKHTWYNKRVYREMKNIRRYEDMRNKIKNI
jgi:hypothetical protein